jgi:outer membrane protein OmpA-like peptidoglycan-associated protein
MTSRPPIASWCFKAGGTVGPPAATSIASNGRLITFDSGSFELRPDQYGQLEAIANAIRQVTEANPNEVFLIEGHTDAVGTEEDNLSLSDRRAEAVAIALTEQFQIPPENLTTQGYGEQQLKVPVQGPNEQNRRVTVRRITPLLAGE